MQTKAIQTKEIPVSGTPSSEFLKFSNYIFQKYRYVAPQMSWVCCKSIILKSFTLTVINNFKKIASYMASRWYVLKILAYKPKSIKSGIKTSFFYPPEPISRGCARPVNFHVQTPNSRIRRHSYNIKFLGNKNIELKTSNYSRTPSKGVQHKTR